MWLAGGSLELHTWLEAPPLSTNLKKYFFKNKKIAYVLDAPSLETHMWLKLLPPSTNLNFFKKIQFLKQYMLERSSLEPHTTYVARTMVPQAIYVVCGTRYVILKKHLPLPRKIF